MSERKTGEQRLTKWFVLSFAVLTVGWAGFAWLVVPGVIAHAYAGESLGPINALIEGQDQHALEVYLAAWRRFAILATCAWIGGAAMAYIALRQRRRLAALWASAVKLIREGRRLSATEVLLLCLGIGLAAGYAELISLAVRRTWFGYLGGMATYSATAFWMTPVAYGLLFLTIGVIGAIAGRWGFRLTLHAGILLIGGLAAFGLIRFSFPQVNGWAALLLAFGVASRCAMAGRARPDAAQRVIRSAAVSLGVLTIVFTAALQGVAAAQEARAGAHLASATGATNVVILLLDTVRSLSMSLYGYEKSTTPNLERFAQESIVFDRAYATAPWTLPSHASIFTGRYHHEQSVGWRAALDGTHPTLAEYLGAKGYETGAFFANPFYGSPRFGLNRGFQHFENEPVSLPAVLENAWPTRELGAKVRAALGNQQLPVRKNAARMNRDLLRWLDGREGRPFFAFVNYFDAHQPYLAPAEYRGTGPQSEQPEDWGEVPSRYTPEQLTAFKYEYEATFGYLDHQVGLLLDELERRGLLENTLVIITSDHGEEFGRHGVVGHGNSLYAASLWVPLVVRLPGPSRSWDGLRVSAFVSLRDIPATVVDLIELAEGAPFPGNSLAALWTGSTVHGESPILSEVTPPPRPMTEWYPVRHGIVRSLVSGGLHYIIRGDGEEELYDVVADPWEATDLAQSPVYAVRLVRMRRVLANARRVSPRWQFIDRLRAPGPRRRRVDPTSDAAGRMRTVSGREL